MRLECTRLGAMWTLEMRFERHGGSPDLAAVFKAFVLQALGGRCLDDNQDKESAAGKFPDFACFRDILLIEMKNLEADQSNRLNQVMLDKIDPAEMPLFYGQREGRLITTVVSNGPAVNSAIGARLNRTIEKILKKANQQFLSYRSRHYRKNTVSICVILNSEIREFSPDVVIHAIHSKMKVGQRKGPRFKHIDAVVFITEKHFRELPDGRLAVGLAAFESLSVQESKWKQQFIDRLIDNWSFFRTGEAAVPSADLYSFGVIQDIRTQ